MRAAAVVFAALSCAVTAFPQAVPEGIAPDEAAPDGCSMNVDGNFTINIAVPVGKRETATDAAGSALGCTLEDGVLKDPYGRIGSIVANYQFQFDGPPQAGAIYTGGFSACENGSLAIGGSARWFRCMSGEFGNLYDRSIGDQCAEVRIVTQMVSGPSSSASSSMASSTPASSSSGPVITSTWSLESASTTASLTPMASGNATMSGSMSRSPSATITGDSTASGTGAGAEETGTASDSTGAAAMPTRVPNGKAFGAAIGILGAALII